MTMWSSSSATDKQHVFAYFFLIYSILIFFFFFFFIFFVKPFLAFCSNSFLNFCSIFFLPFCSFLHTHIVLCLGISIVVSEASIYTLRVSPIANANLCQSCRTRSNWQHNIDLLNNKNKEKII